MIFNNLITNELYTLNIKFQNPKDLSINDYTFIEKTKWLVEQEFLSFFNNEFSTKYETIRDNQYVTGYLIKEITLNNDSL